MITAPKSTSIALPYLLILLFLGQVGILYLISLLEGVYLWDFELKFYNNNNSGHNHRKMAKWDEISANDFDQNSSKIGNSKNIETKNKEVSSADY